MRFRTICAVLLTVVLTVRTATAGSITVAPGLDNTLIQVTSASAKELSNGEGDIFVGRTAQDGSGSNSGPATISIRRGLVEFDIADNVPPDATITGVTLTMRDVMGIDGSQTISLYRVVQAWGQGTSFQNGGMGANATQNDATWYYTFYDVANPSASPTWNTPGGSFSSTLSASTVDTDNSTLPELFSWSATQMIADVQYWLANPTDNFGRLIQGNESTGKTAKQFNGMYSTTSPNVPSELTITWSVPEPSTVALWCMIGLTLGIGWAVRRR